MNILMTASSVRQITVNIITDRPRTSSDIFMFCVSGLAADWARTLCIATFIVCSEREEHIINLHFVT